MLNDSQESYQYARVLRSAQNDYSSQNGSLSITQDKEEASLGEQEQSHTYSVKKLKKTLNHLKIELIIDGNHDFGLSKKLGIPIATVVKGDSIHKELSAASICAKVERDWHMIRQAKKFPLYGFDRHKGYGTAYHRAMIKKH